MKFDRTQGVQWLAYVGLIVTVVGYIRSSVNGEPSRLYEGLMIGGGVLILAAAILGYRGIIAFFRKPSAQLGTNTLTLGALVIVILGVLNYLGYKHHKRLDWTTEKLFTLSEQTRKIVSGLNKDVLVIRFDNKPDEAFRDLVAEYTGLGHHVHYELVDPQEKPEMAREYNVTRMGQVVVSSGSKNQSLEGTTEQDLTNAIVKITRDTVKTICFVEGHGEKSVTSTESDGYSGADHSLKGDGFETKSVNLVSEGQVPADCSVLVDAGPKQAVFPQEAQMIEKYLEGGGKALLLLDPETDPGLDAVLQSWNIALGKNVVIDASGLGQVVGAGPAIPLVVDYGASPITQGFQNRMTFFPLARTASIADKTKTDPQDTELLKTSSRSFTVPNLKTKEIRYDPKTDTAGPLSLGVAAERKSSPGDAGKDSRLVVIGNSNFASNRWGGLQRNGDLFLNTIDWLSQDEDLISIRPKSVTNRGLALTEAQQRMLTWVSLFILPGFVVLCGGLIWWKRR